MLSESLEQNMWQRATAELSPLDYATFSADVAGIFDPTPISDTIGAGLSLAQGDFVGAGLSILGYIPYVGDLGKIAKVSRYAPETARMMRALLTRADEFAAMRRADLESLFSLDQVAAARRRAAERVREAMLRCRQNPNSRICRKIGQLQMARSNGTWNTPDGLPPADGNATFTFDNPRTYTDANGQQVTVTSVDYEDGFPNFRGNTYNGTHDLWDVSGSASTDATRLHQQNPDLARPDPADWVLHHFEDGQVGYVPRTIHDRGQQGASHSGGQSIINNDVF
ncbi:putative Rhs-family protein [Sulfitobacter noctilucae]|nr:putative Rhs-family protein [Sulfitobacter noctilucae]